MDGKIKLFMPECSDYFFDGQSYESAKEMILEAIKGEEPQPTEIIIYD